MASCAATGPQPSTSSSGSRAAEGKPKISGESFIYDISLELQVDIPNSGFDHSDVMAAVSTILAGHIFTVHPDWNFLATPITRIFDSALAVPGASWADKENRHVTQKTFTVKGHLVNIADKPSKCSTTYDQVQYRGCVNQMKVMLNYNIKFLFMPATIAAEKVYNSHGWTGDQTSQADDVRSLKLREVLKRHKENASFNHELAWREMFGVAGERTGEKTAKAGDKRKHDDTE